jgi:hypothetical protein
VQHHAAVHGGPHGAEMGVVALTLAQLPSPGPPGGWPGWCLSALYDGRSHPGVPAQSPIAMGANCQRYAYAVVGLFGLTLPPHRSSELWSDKALEHPGERAVRDLDLVLFNRSADAWGADVAVLLNGRLLHLCAEVGSPAVWDWGDFAARERYRHRVGVVRIPH